jgi:hypothetical protein
MLYELATDKMATIAQIIGYNRYYLTFYRPINYILRTQLHTLYNSLSNFSLSAIEDICIWKWGNNDIFSTNSYYIWLEYGSIVNL